jgi:hypothetical protein
MAFFEVGGVYRQKYLIESVVPFFQGELAIAVYEDKRYYLQSASLNRQAPLRAISQYRNLKLPQVIPYLDVFAESGMLVFIRPYVEIRPLREVITTQELSEEQVVKWIKELLHVEAVLRSKPMSMYLLLDLRNVGIDSQNELKLFFCGLEQIMVYESKLDWGTFIYSMLSGQFLDGPILKLPRNFKVSRPMARLIQKSFKEYKVPPVLEQVEIFESKNTSGGLLGKFWGEKKEENSTLLIPTASRSKSSADTYLTPTNRPIHRADRTVEEPVIRKGFSPSTTTVTHKSLYNETDQERVVIQERGSLVKEDDTKSLEQTENTSSNDQTESSVATVFQDEAKEEAVEQEPVEQEQVEQEQVEQEPEDLSVLETDEDDFSSEEPLIGVKDEASEIGKETRPVFLTEVPIKANEEEPQVTFREIEVEPSVSDKIEEPISLSANQRKEESEPTVEKSSSEEKPVEETKKEQAKEEQPIKEESKKTHPDANLTTIKVSPALAQLEGQDLSQSFVLKLNKQQEELEKEQQERLKKMREEYERREQELIEEHRRKLEAEQKRLLEEQRQKLARLQEEARLAKERKRKEELRKAKLAKVRKQFVAKQKAILEKEEKAYQERQEVLLAKLLIEYEERKAALLKQEEEEYHSRTKAQLAALQEEQERIEATINEEELVEEPKAANPSRVEESAKKESKVEIIPQVEITFEEEKPSVEITSESDDLISDEPKDSNDQVVDTVDESAILKESEPVTKEENAEIDNVFAEVLPPNKVKSEKEPEETEKPKETIGKESVETVQVVEPKEKSVEDPSLKSEAVISELEKSEKDSEEKPKEKQVNETESKPELETKQEDSQTEEEENFDETQEAAGEDAPKKKRRRRRRRRKKKTTDGADEVTEEVAASASSSTQESNPSSSEETDSMEEARKRRELELQQMERELLEMEQQDALMNPKPKPEKKPKEKQQSNKKPAYKSTKPKQEEQPKKEIRPKQEVLPKKEVPPKQESETAQTPVVAKKTEVPVVKDTTEHATLAKQFEQYLKLFKRKK